MHASRLAIVGGGLSGLYAAWLLERRGVQDYVLLEARESPGGRIASVEVSGPAAPVATANAIDRVDLGPTWYWPDLQPELHGVVEAFGLERFEQFESGDTVVERSSGAPPVRTRGYVSAPTSMRLAGGMGALIDALRRELDPARIVTGRTVRRLRTTGARVELDAVDAAGRVANRCAAHVLLAVPPRLAEHGIAFDPPLPPALARQWRATPTWMAPHAKYVAVYDTPFWRAQGLSGGARSARGPMAEIHDASTPGGCAALFGFIGVPARARAGILEHVMLAHCRAQLARLFGSRAATPRREFLKDWAQEAFTAVPADLDAPAHHAEAPAATADSGPWHERLVGIASEWSPQFPGYVAGAVEAARMGVETVERFADLA